MKKQRERKLRQGTSIIVPTYNRAKKLRECLTALTDGIRANEEIVVIDDGSTDATPQICSRFRNVKYYRITHCGKPGVLRNYGVARAHYAMIVFVEDDLVVPQTFWKKVRTLHAPTFFICVNTRQDKYNCAYQAIYEAHIHRRTKEGVQSLPLSCLAVPTAYAQKNPFEESARLSDIWFTEKLSKKNPITIDAELRIIHNSIDTGEEFFRKMRTSIRCEMKRYGKRSLKQTFRLLLGKLWDYVRWNYHSKRKIQTASILAQVWWYYEQEIIRTIRTDTVPPQKKHVHDNTYANR